MQQDASNPKQLIVDRVRQSTNILVAVSANPSVDALAAALGLTLMLNKLDKHATAVFSGTLPPAIEFLQPGKTFENSVDSLRDFIISLDKEKADRLRYKVEDDVVRIFITPYRTTLTNKDLQFSQGDFNVDLILALGVEKRDDLDKAIIAHGRILHDATVMTINPNNVQSSLGAVDWHEPGASSLCEMLVILADALQHPGMLDQQSATALLTGIVAATDRFSNEHTTPQVMTMAAQLMAAGANQQLIANNLVKAHELSSAAGNGKLVADAPSIKVANEQPKPDGELDISHVKKDDTNAVAAPTSQSTPEQKPAGQQPKSDRPAKNKKGRGGRTPEEELAAALPSSAAAASAFDELKNAIESDSAQGSTKAPGSQTVNGASANEDEDQAPQQPEGYVVGNSSWRGRRLEPPSLGGALSATTEQAHDDSIKAQEAERNQKLLTHPDSPKAKAKDVTPPKAEAPKEPKAQQSPEPAKPTEAKETPKKEEQVAASAPVAAPEPSPIVEPAPEVLPEPAPVAAPEPTYALQPAPEPVAPPTANEQPQPEPMSSATPVPVDLDAARQAVDEALASQPFDVAGQPLESVGAAPINMAQPPAPTPVVAEAPVFTQPLPESPAPAQTPDAAQVSAAPRADVLPPLPPMPPLPQHDPLQPLAPPPSLDSLPPLPPEATVVPPTPFTPEPAPVAAPEPVPQAQPQAPADPKQFQIPT